MKLQNKILVVSWTIPPVTSASAILVHELYRELGEFQLLVLGEDVGLETGNKVKEFHYHTTHFLSFQKGNRYFKWLSWFALVKKIQKLCETHTLVKIVAIFPDEYFTSAAIFVANQKKIPIQIWFHNTYLENRKGVFKLLATFLQPWMMKNTHSFFAISESLVDFYRDKYKLKNISLLAHGFKIPDFFYTDPHIASPKLDRPSTPYTFIFTGNINASNEHATKILFAAISSQNLGIIQLCTGTPKYYLEEKGLLFDCVDYKGFLPESEFYDLLKAADFALLTHGLEGDLSDTEYTTILPTRVIPLLFSGSPILALVPKDCYLDYFLRKHECAIILNREAECGNLSRHLSDQITNTSIVEKAKAIVLRYDIRHIAKQFSQPV